MSLAVWRCALVVYFVHSVRSQDVAVLTFNSSTVHIGEPVTLTCSCRSGVHLLQMTVEAFNGSLKKGFLFYRASPANCTGVEVFEGKCFDRWPNIPYWTTNVSVTLTATPSLELNYNCTAIVYDDFFMRVNILSSAPASLHIFAERASVTSSNYDMPLSTGQTASKRLLDWSALPLPPVFTHTPIVFNESDSAFITCESRYGRPAAAITLTVTSPIGRKAITNGSESASLILPSPVADWHGATATCTVTNHNISNSSVSSSIIINHVNRIRIPEILNTTANNVTLDCASCIRSYPEVRYSWTAQLDSNVTEYAALSGSSILTLMQGQSGLYICIAANSVTTKAVAVVFIVRDTLQTDCSLCEQCWIIGSAAGAVVAIIATILGVLYKRGQCSKRLCSRRTHKKQQSDTLATERSVTETTLPHCDERQYEILNTQRKTSLTYEQLTKENNESSVATYENVLRSKPSS